MEMKWHPIVNGDMSRVPRYEELVYKCLKCKYVHLQHDEDDEDSDDWFECELLECDVPANGKPEDCPLRQLNVE